MTGDGSSGGWASACYKGNLKYKHAWRHYIWSNVTGQTAESYNTEDQR